MKKLLVLALVLWSTVAHAAGVRLNSKGDVAHGVGGYRASVNNVAVGQGGSPGWITDTDVVYGGVQNGTEWKILNYNTVTKQTTILDAKGGNTVAAGGGVWARWLGDRVTGLTTSTGFSCPKCGLHEVGPDGVVYYTRDFQLSKGMVARYPDGREVEVEPETMTMALALRGVPGGAIWSGYDGRLHGWGVVPQPVQVPGWAGSPSAVRVNGEWWVVYITQDGFVAHPYNSLMGYRLGVGDKFFYPDAMAFNGGIRVAWSTTQGAWPGQMKVLDLDLSRPREDLTVYVPPMQRPFTAWTGWFFADSVRYVSTTTNVPGSVSVVVETGLRPTLPVVISRNLIGEYRMRWDRVVAIYVSDEDGALEMEAGTAVATMKGYGLPLKPVLSYTSRRIVFAQHVDWVGIECYVNAGETPLQAEAVWRNRAYRAAGGKPVVMITGAYDRSIPLSVPTMTEGLYRAAEVARDTKARAILWFAWARPGGGKQYPQVAAAAARVAASATTPPLERYPAPQVTIASYAPTSGPHPLRVRAVRTLSGGPAVTLTWRYRPVGATSWTTAAVNAATDPDHTFQFNVAGTYEIGVDAIGPGGKNGTGLPRKVVVQ